MYYAALYLKHESSDNGRRVKLSRSSVARPRRSFAFQTKSSTTSARRKPFASVMSSASNISAIAEVGPEQTDADDEEESDLHLFQEMPNEFDAAEWEWHEEESL